MTRGVMMLVSLFALCAAQADNVSLSQDGSGNHYVNMPFSGRNTLNLDGTVTSFKLYDNGGGGNMYIPTYNYSFDCNGWLELIAPEGYVMRVTGYMMTSYYDRLSIYDGSSENDFAFVDNLIMRDGVITNIGKYMTSGRNMLVHFWADGTRQYGGLDFTVDLVKANEEHQVNVISTEGCTVTPSKTSAKAGELITLSLSPDIGCMIAGVRVHAEPRNFYETVCIREDETWYTNNDNQVVFNMPNCNATVIPVVMKDYYWSHNDGLYIDMPTRGTKDVYLIANIQSVKIYDDGGGGVPFGPSQYSINYFHNYSRCCDSYLKLRAPAGYVISLTGSMDTQYGHYLDVYDGLNESTAIKLGDQLGYASGTADIGTIVSSGSEMMLHFISEDDPTTMGLDLTAEVILPPQVYDLGDVNGDHTIDVQDVNIVINIILNKDAAEDYDGRADIDGVDGVDVSDVNALVNIILHKD